jgi:hypothetical protein
MRNAYTKFPVLRRELMDNIRIDLKAMGFLDENLIEPAKKSVFLLNWIGLAYWLRHYATSHNVTDSRPDDAN